MILQTMYQNAIKNQVRFFNEFLVLDLLLNDGQACGVVADEIRTCEIHTFHAKAETFATGGYGRAWRVTSNAFACMGDGMSIAYRRGIPGRTWRCTSFTPQGYTRWVFCSARQHVVKVDVSLMAKANILWNATCQP